MRNLASIQKISALQPILGADAIEVASILGWKVVVKKGEFSEGDLCVYCEIDSVLPPKPEFDFLASKKYRIKTIKLRGQISQGIAFPLNVLCPADAFIFPEGLDVTELMGIVKYEVPEVQISTQRAFKSGKVGGNFPAYVHKTDETRIQSIPGIMEEIKDTPCYVSVKIDGTSGTFAIKNGKIDVCSRTVSRKDPRAQSFWERIVEWYRWARYKKSRGVPESCVYWDIAYKYDLIEVLKKHKHIAIQGEIAGPNIQGNKLALKEHQLFVFNVFDTETQKYYAYEEFISFCKDNNLQTVPIIQVGWVPNKKCNSGESQALTIDDFLEMSKGNYPSGYIREGIVVRAMGDQDSHVLRGRLSFKVINNDFLLKEK